jgi:uncharacterized protein (TIGR02646 family)
MIALVVDIARRACVLNPQLGEEVFSRTSGIVLIDELDLHLHPQWQRRLPNSLKEAFPAMQFITTTHSPQILSELSPNEIILLRGESACQPEVSYGMTSDRILEDIMETASRPQKIKELLSKLFIAIERDLIDEAKEYIEELSEKAPGIAEIASARALINKEGNHREMIRVFKGQEPEWLLNWKKQEISDWKALYANLREKDRLLETLLKGQGGLCCYCGREAKFENSHIEHFKPQSQYSHLEVDYDNLHASCIKSPAPGSIKHCGHAKGDNFDENLFISPIDADCEKRFLYTLEGEIWSKDPSDKASEYMINTLNLNASPLVGRRKEVLTRTLSPELLNNISIEELQKLRTVYQERDLNGLYQEFRHVLSRYIDEL